MKRVCGRRFSEAKCRARRTMKNLVSNAYIQLCQINGNIWYGKCNCKAGKAGC